MANRGLVVGQELVGTRRLSADPYDAELSDHLDRAARRLEATLLGYAPHLAPAVLAWFRGLAPGGEVASYYRHERRFPMLLLPRWLSRALGTSGDTRFQEDLVYSTVAGYAAIRLLDDTLDGAEPRFELLPAGVILQAEFQRALGPYFAGDHPFWEIFRRQWYGAADFAGDHEGTRDFDCRVDRRLGPALIPLAAVAYRAERADRLGVWTDFLGRLARVEQLLDDLTDWLVDSAGGAPNIVLAAYPARAQPGEPVEAWMLRDGLGYGQDLAEAWLDDLAAAAGPLDSPEVAGFLARRRAIVQELRAETGPGLRELARLREAFGSSD